MPKSKNLQTLRGDSLDILANIQEDIMTNMIENRHLTGSDLGSFFEPSIEDLRDPYLLPDMQSAVDRILLARERGERVVIFGDYDVDGVSSTAILFKFFSEIGVECSYRLPHRVHDGYGLKKYFFDELTAKDVKLVVTVDCGTRDIEVIEYAKSLGIDVIVTDHHAVPERIPEGVPILNPKRKDSQYPFSSLAGAGVAFKLVHGMIEEMKKIGLRHRERSVAIQEDQKDWIASCLAMTEKEHYNRILRNFIDLASLGTVADCMPLVDENRVITKLGLKQMKTSTTSALRKYIENLDKEVEGNADVIGFQIGPRINAAGRMDSPLKALHWLLAEESRVDAWLEEIEGLNRKRQEVVEFFVADALSSVDTDSPILFYLHEKLEHGLVGLVAGKLTEAYGKPSIVLCPHSTIKNEKGIINNEIKKREYEKESIKSENDKNHELVASCRSPEWCNLVELLDVCKDFFVRYGGHRQAAGFTIESSRFADFQRAITESFTEKYGETKTLPKKTIRVEGILSPSQLTLETLDQIDRFRPFGIGNLRPLFLLEDITITECRTIGSAGNHLSLRFAEKPDMKLLYWKGVEDKGYLEVGNIVSLLVELDRNEWNGKSSLQGIVREIVMPST